MITQISITAGIIWEFLDKNEEVELSRLIESLDDSRDLILMSLGWLIREGYVMLERNKQDCKLSLRKDNKKSEKNITCPYLQKGRQNLCLACPEVTMTPSVEELENFCFSGQYDSCPWRQKSRLEGLRN